MNIVFTICSANYLSAALSLKESFEKHNVDLFFVVLTDKSPIDKKANNIIEVEEIGIAKETFDTLLDEYNIIEFNTAIKPFAFTYFNKTYTPDKIMYLDPDILVFDSLNLIWKSIDDNDFAITPHILSPDISPDLYHLLLASINTGVFNLGFIAICMNERTVEILKWWQKHLTTYGHNRITKGEFYDQKVMNLLPVFSDRVSILKHPGMNIAEWNFHERQLTTEDGKYYSNNQPVIFFHFSGIKISSFEKNSAANRLLKSIHCMEAYRDIIDYYITMNKKNRHEAFSKIECCYNLKPNIHRDSRATVYKYKLKKWFKIK
jgi:hypothetical protein